VVLLYHIKLGFLLIGKKVYMTPIKHRNTDLKKCDIIVMISLREHEIVNYNCKLTKNGGKTWLSITETKK